MVTEPDTRGDTEDEPEQGSQAPAQARPHLFVVLTGDRPLTGGARYSLSGVGVVTLGRGEVRMAARSTDGALQRLELRLPGTTVSSMHARLVPSDAGWVLEDAGSRNGTLVNGKPVGRAELRDGDLIEIGSSILCFRAALPTSDSVPDDLDGTTLTPPAPGLATLLPHLTEQLAALERIARTPVPVLLLGESGSGKEVLARAVHLLSGRAGAFVAVNCGGLAASLLESQLFGHVRGSFTGAARNEPGYIRSADRGTLFLDEIGDLPLPAQAALLRVLQEHEVVPVGGTSPVKVDLRVVAATHRPLQQMAARGEFRSDLLARLSGYRHPLPPLRSRREDLGLVIASLLPRLDVPGAPGLRFSARAAHRLAAHDWPLNFRELQQCLAVSAALAVNGVVEPEHLSLEASSAPVPSSSLSSEHERDPEALRRTLIELLGRHRGKVSHVARDMGKARMQIHRWMQRFGIDPNSFRG